MRRKTFNTKPWFHLHKQDCAELRDISNKFDLPELRQQWHWSNDHAKLKKPVCFDRTHFVPQNHRAVAGMGWIKVDDWDWPVDHDCLKPQASIDDLVKKDAFDQGKVGWNRRTKKRTMSQMKADGTLSCVD